METITQEKTIDSFEINHNTYYLDKMADGSFSISKDENIIESNIGEHGMYWDRLNIARQKFDKHRVVNGLKVDEVYWIQTGSGSAIQGILTGFNHNQTAGLFGGIPRKVTSIYLTKEEAENGEY